MLPIFKYLLCGIQLSYWTLIFRFSIDFLGFPRFKTVLPANTAIFHHFFLTVIPFIWCILAWYQISEMLLGMLILLSDVKGNSISFPISRPFKADILSPCSWQGRSAELTLLSWQMQGWDSMRIQWATVPSHRG